MAEDKWTADSNECIEVVLTRGGEAGPSFNPTFTHTIFEEETIFGFSDLAISLYCGAASLRQCLDIQYDKKHNKADDLESALTEFLAPDVSRDVDEYMRSILDTEASFTPPGTLVASYTVDKKGKSKRTIPDIVDGQISNAENTVYEAYAADWHTDGWTDWHRRMQVFNRLLIDGASDIDEQDPSWSFIALFERSKSRYSFVGFVSLFAFFYYSPSLHERRQKLAQFFILPPFQGHGHGAALYAICRRKALADDVVAEFAVEDPSEAFEDLRDKCDLAMLHDDAEFGSASLSDPKADLEKLRRRLKLASRQFYRLLEMKTLRELEASTNGKEAAANGKGKKRKAEDDIERDFRLAVKKRLYLFNKDTLDQVDADERKEKLQLAYDNVVDHYRQLVH